MDVGGGDAPRRVAPSRSLRRSKGLITSVAIVVVLGLGGASFLFLTRKSPTQLAGSELNQGLAAQVAGQLDLAASDYQQVIKNDPKNKFAYFDLGVVAQTRGNNAQSESYYRQALNIDPNFTGALYNLAIVRKAQGDSQGALTLYRQAIATSPQDADAHLNLGFLLIELGQQAEGRSELRQAIQLNPNLASRVPASDLEPTSPSPSSK